MMSDPRPLSPHLQIYRWQLTSVLSILHRFTGVALSVGAILLVWWLGAASDGPEAYASVQQFSARGSGLLLLFGWTVALFYHLCNGIRHLVWDTGHGLELTSVYAGGWIVLAATAGVDRSRLGARALACGDIDMADRATDALAARPGDRARLRQGGRRALVAAADHRDRAGAADFVVGRRR